MVQFSLTNLFGDRNELGQVERSECPLHCITTHTMHRGEGELQLREGVLLPSVAVLLDLGEVSLQDGGQRVHDLGGQLFQDGCVPGSGPGGEVCADVT